MRSSHMSDMLYTLKNGGELSTHLDVMKWPWSIKMIDQRIPLSLTKKIKPPEMGDVALVRVKEIGYHRKIIMANGDRLRLHKGDIIAGVFGNRYATDAYEAEVKDLEDLHILTNAGMIGTVLSKRQTFKSPTTLSFMGYLSNENGDIINTKTGKVLSVAAPTTHNIIFVVGTSMNSGKTTTATRLTKGFIDKGHCVSVCKLTGSICPGDQMEFQSIFPDDIRVFSDYGLPSTYLTSKEELIALFHNMITDAMRVSPDVIIVEVADGILQRETQMIMKDPEIRKYIKGVIITATCAPSALFTMDQIIALGHKVIGVSGLMTTKPLCVKEFKAFSTTPVFSSFDTDFDFSKFNLIN